MKKAHIFFLFLAITLYGYLPKAMSSSPISPLDLTIWSEYKTNHFETLSKEERTEKLQTIFQDLEEFVKKHHIRHLIIKILDPSSFPFFHPENFDWEQPDNIFYWIKELSPIPKIEVLFDKEAFNLGPISYNNSFASIYHAIIDQINMKYPPFGDFQNLVEKLDWLSIFTQFYTKDSDGRHLINGIVIDPTGIEPVDPLYQNLINALDRYKYTRNTQASSLCYNPNPELQIAMLLPLDQRDLALANLAGFPLYESIKGESNASLGIKLPSSFPSDASGHTPPVWRNSRKNKEPLLNAVYLQLADKRLIPSIYQNRLILSNPLITSPENNDKIAHLAVNLAKNFQGIPFAKGPGTISNPLGCFYLIGNQTFFLSGSPKNCQGQLSQRQKIEIRPPFVNKPVCREVAKDPCDNHWLQLKDPFSLAHNIENADYYYTPIAGSWSDIKTSSFLQSRIYFVVSTEFNVQEGNCYFGNWNRNNFISFFLGAHPNRGFLHQLIFKNLNGKLTPPNKNIVLYDYSLIPNQGLYPQNDWKLDNAPINDASLNRDGFIIY